MNNKQNTHTHKFRKQLSNQHKTNQRQQTNYKLPTRQRNKQYTNSRQKHKSKVSSDAFVHKTNIQTKKQTNSGRSQCSFGTCGQKQTKKQTVATCDTGSLKNKIYHNYIN